MILDKIENCTTYAGLSEHFRKAFDYLATGAYKQLPVAGIPLMGTTYIFPCRRMRSSPGNRAHGKAIGTMRIFRL